MYILKKNGNPELKVHELFLKELTQSHSNFTYTTHSSNSF